MKDSNIKIGVDIGRSHINAGLVNIETKSLIVGSYINKGFDSCESDGFIINELLQIIDSLVHYKDYEVKEIGIAIPGPFDYKKGISLMSNKEILDSLYGLNLKQILANHLGLKSYQLITENDASCFLLGEVYSGSLIGFNNVIGINIGKGLGSAFYIDGKVRDANLWKMTFMNGIAEDYISTRWLIKRWKDLTDIDIKEVKEIVDSTERKNEISELFDEFAKNLAQFLYTFIRKRHPSAVVIGGDIMIVDHLFLNKVQRHLFEKIGISVPVLKSNQGEVATLLGAAFLFKS
jgi:glucokinase